MTAPGSAWSVSIKSARRIDGSDIAFSRLLSVADASFEYDYEFNGDATSIEVYDALERLIPHNSSELTSALFIGCDNSVDIFSALIRHAIESLDIQQNPLRFFVFRIDDYDHESAPVLHKIDDLHVQHEYDLKKASYTLASLKDQPAIYLLANTSICRVYIRVPGSSQPWELFQEISRSKSYTDALVSSLPLRGLPDQASRGENGMLNEILAGWFDHCSRVTAIGGNLTLQQGMITPPEKLKPRPLMSLLRVGSTNVTPLPDDIVQFWRSTPSPLTPVRRRNINGRVLSNRRLSNASKMLSDVFGDIASPLPMLTRGQREVREKERLPYIRAISSLEDALDELTGHANGLRSVSKSSWVAVERKRKRKYPLLLVVFSVFLLLFCISMHGREIQLRLPERVIVLLVY